MASISLSVSDIMECNCSVETCGGADKPRKLERCERFAQSQLGPMAGEVNFSVYHRLDAAPSFIVLAIFALI